MKEKLIKKSISILGICFVLALYSNNALAQNNSALVGSWVFQETPSFASITAENNAYLNANPQLLTQLQTDYLNRTLIFNANGTFSQQTGTGANFQGTWAITGNVLVITAPSGSQWIQEIIQLTANQVILKQSASGDTEPMLPELYFSKV